MRLAYATILLSVIPISTQAASQVEALYEVQTKDATATIDIDLSKVVPSEEVPAIGKILSGNGEQYLKSRILAAATTILRIHVLDGRPTFHELQPSLPEVIQEFQALVPILTNHFNDAIPRSSIITNGTNDGDEIIWKTGVVQFMDTLGAPPSPEMVTWMLQVLQWPEGRADQAIAVMDSLNPNQTKRDRELSYRTIQRDARGNALNMVPVLTHLDPMPLSVWNALLTKIDDSSEPRVAAAIMFMLSQNKSINGSELGNLLVTKALDTNLPVEMRAAAIHGIGFLNIPAARARLRGLDRDPDDTIAHAAIDAGVNNIDILDMKRPQ